MAHASEKDIGELEDVLAEIRGIEGLVEKPKPGLFRYRGRPFLHFHRFGDRSCFDVRTASGFRRIDVAADKMEDLLVELRQIEGVVEPKTGLFRYRGRDATSRHQIARKVREALEGLR